MGQGNSILPVFAGMIPTLTTAGFSTPYSPRIRGDDPEGEYIRPAVGIFSPYLRG